MKSFIVFAALFALSNGECFQEMLSFNALRLNPLMPDGRIVGGVDTDITQVPYQVALESNGNHFCGGTLISDSVVLTAAHCMIFSPSTLRVRAGSSRRGNGGVVAGVTSAKKHPKYNQYNLDYDVAIMRLSNRIPISEKSKPILPTSSEVTPDTNLKVSGWGMTREGGQCAEQLQSVLVPVISRQKCQQMYAPHKITVTNRMVCAYALGKDSCQGDSGGPAVANGHVSGIVSWGVGCARPNFPGVYTNVADPEVRQFIKQESGV
ncbi:UNVERIFIED_CONTAM: hypothetical protein PYX00_009349 [Menopon gallinae]|uniref:Peptidase S1 domain-containing protein n=1 Tax=Menopon gallinae TaxID=328185 RepID=A0AAW2HB08_9NEOP